MKGRKDDKGSNGKDVIYILDIYNDAILNTTAVYTYKPVTLENRIDWYEQKG